MMKRSKHVVKYSQRVTNRHVGIICENQCVAVLTKICGPCDQNVWPFWFVAFMVLWPMWSVALMVCVRCGVRPSWYVAL